MIKMIFVFVLLFAGTVSAQSRMVLATNSGFTSHCAMYLGEVKCWGRSSSIRDVPELKRPKAVAVGGNHACAIDQEGVKCWGYDRHGELKVPSLKNPRAVSAGDGFSCALDESGVQCWGKVERKTFYYTFHSDIKVPELKNPIAIASGYRHSCAIDDNGMECWAEYSDESATSTARGASSIKNPRAMASGAGNICAIDGNEVKCWGYNDYEQSIEPKLKNPKLISAGVTHTCAVDDSGVVCWGDNSKGQLEAPAVKNPTSLAAGFDHTCVVDDEGLKCWGNIYESELPKFKKGPHLEKPDFNIDNLDDFLGVLAQGSTPARTALFTDLQKFYKQNLTVADESKLNIQQLYFLKSSRYALISLIAPAILSADSEYYLNTVIPAYRSNMQKVSADLSMDGLSSIYLDGELIRKTVLKVMHSTLQVMSEFLTIEERASLQETIRMIGVAMASSPNRQSLLDVLNSIKKNQAVFAKLDSSPKTAFLVRTLLTTAEWVDLKIK